ncbi:hypothetical protein OROMI_001777 [Orobanche minor]
MPKGTVSFERKVLPFKNDSIHITYPDADFWRTSINLYANLRVHHSGGIEDQSNDAVEVDFADPYFGGIVLDTGCLQEEIRFMINPELIVGMLFLPAMADNEAIEIVGAERFSRCTYSSSFRFSGDYVDERDIDTLGRRKTRIVAIDALSCLGMSQYMENFVLRRGKAVFQKRKLFANASDELHFAIPMDDAVLNTVNLHLDTRTISIILPHSRSRLVFVDYPSESLVLEAASFSPWKSDRPLLVNKALCGFVFKCNYQLYQKVRRENGCSFALGNNVGIATGNWGCGVFGGDPEIKTIIQWLAASQIW